MLRGYQWWEGGWGRCDNRLRCQLPAVWRRSSRSRPPGIEAKHSQWCAAHLLWGTGRGTGVSIEIKSIALTRIDPGPIVARLDANSGITYRFGSALSRAPNLAPDDPPINVGGGFSINPVATDQISRFNQNGMTNMFINAETPDAGDAGFMGYQYRLILRGAPGPQTFDGEDAMVNIRARLTEPLTNPNIAQNMTIIAKDLDGSDLAAGEGADEYTAGVALNQFNTTSMTTVSIPLSQFMRNTAMPFGFTNAGDDSLENFNLYEFGLGVLPGGGLLKMELEYLEIRTAAANWLVTTTPTAKWTRRIT